MWYVCGSKHRHEILLVKGLEERTFPAVGQQTTGGRDVVRTPMSRREGGGLHHEVHVSFRPGDDDVHPDAHGVRGRSHHVVHAVVSLHAERQRGVGALRLCDGEREREGGRGGGCRRERERDQEKCVKIEEREVTAMQSRW